MGAHFPAALISGGILLASVVLPLSGLPFGPICTFLRLTGYPCPFCGSTRAFIAMGHGRWLEAWHQSPMATGLFAGVTAVFVWNAAALAAGLIVRPGAGRMWGGRNRRWLAGIFCAMLAANWIYRIACGLT